MIMRPTHECELIRMAPFVYSKEAEKITQQLWEDTMKELSFAEVHDVAENPSSTHK